MYGAIASYLGGAQSLSFFLISAGHHDIHHNVLDRSVMICVSELSCGLSTKTAVMVE